MTTHSWGVESSTDRATLRRIWGWRCSCGAHYTRYRTRHAAESHGRRHARTADAVSKSGLIIEGDSTNG